MSRMPAANPASGAPMPRYSTVHSNSSAFSASAGPNEDWTKISDLAERRRIQNRIAQRNYRKKLKRRLEDLERRAGSTSASPEPEPQQQQSTVSNTISRPRAHTLAVPPSATKRRTSSNTFQHHVLSSSFDDTTTFLNSTRHQSPAASSIFSQPAFSAADTSYAPSYTFTSSYPSPSVTTADTTSYGSYMLPSTTPMPAMTAHKSDIIKSEQFDGDINNFPFSYFQADFDLNKASVYRDISNTTPFTPPFSDTTEAFADSFPCSSMGSPPMDMWALYPSPPASIAEDDPPIFSIPLDLALDEPDFFRSL